MYLYLIAKPLCSVSGIRLGYIRIRAYREDIISIDPDTVTMELQYNLAAVVDHLGNFCEPPGTDFLLPGGLYVPSAKPMKIKLVLRLEFLTTAREIFPFTAAARAWYKLESEYCL